jgi:hypothetical protein
VWTEGPRDNQPVIADQWYTKASFLDGDVLLFDLGSNEAEARQLFRDQRRQYERAKNNPSVHKHVGLGMSHFPVRGIIHLELIEPGSETDGEVVVYEWIK